MELRLPLEMSPGREAAGRAVFGTWGFFRTMHGSHEDAPVVLHHDDVGVVETEGRGGDDHQQPGAHIEELLGPHEEQDLRMLVGQHEDCITCGWRAGVGYEAAPLRSKASVTSAVTCAGVRPLVS